MLHLRICGFWFPNHNFKEQNGPSWKWETRLPCSALLMDSFIANDVAYLVENSLYGPHKTFHACILNAGSLDALLKSWQIPLFLIQQRQALRPSTRIIYKTDSLVWFPACNY